MNGLELARYYFVQFGQTALEEQFPELWPRMAVGLAGEGSECFGFDDAWSRDHDWGPAFCIWLSAADYAQYGAQVQAVYDQLPQQIAGFSPRKPGPHSQGRVGCLSMPQWYTRYTGGPEGPHTLDEWRRVPEHFLATATNGVVFWDPSGAFSAVRQRLLAFYPEDIRLKKMAARAAVMAQAGQYNYPRSLRRGAHVPAALALAAFLQAAMSMVYLLNRRYAPFYKWMQRGLYDLPRLSHIARQTERLSCSLDGAANQQTIETICAAIADELHRQGLSASSSGFLLDHGQELLGQIQDPALRQTHIMEE